MEPRAVALRLMEIMLSFYGWSDLELFVEGDWDGPRTSHISCHKAVDPVVAARQAAFSAAK
jgi:hypothetical protein